MIKTFNLSVLLHSYFLNVRTKNYLINNFRPCLVQLLPYILISFFHFRIKGYILLKTFLILFVILYPTLRNLKQKFTYPNKRRTHTLTHTHKRNPLFDTTKPTHLLSILCHDFNLIEALKEVSELNLMYRKPKIRIHQIILLLMNK